MKKILAIVVLVLLLLALLVGCSEADKVNANISKQAEYFGWSLAWLWG